MNRSSVSAPFGLSPQIEAVPTLQTCSMWKGPEWVMQVEPAGICGRHPTRMNQPTPATTGLSRIPLAACRVRLSANRNAEPLSVVFERSVPDHLESSSLIPISSTGGNRPQTAPRTGNGPKDPGTSGLEESRQRRLDSVAPKGKATTRQPIHERAQPAQTESISHFKLSNSLRRRRLCV